MMNDQTETKALASIWAGSKRLHLRTRLCKRAQTFAAG